MEKEGENDTSPSTSAPTTSSCENCEHDPCLLNPCNHGGECSHQDGLISCNCTDGFVGDYCELSECDVKDPCENGGNCVHTEQDGITCVCQPGYSGDYCEITPCSYNQCVNGSCLIVEADYSCNCDSDFIGEFCEYENPCLSRPCQNGGICIPNGPEYACDCKKPYLYGKNCESDHPCFEYKCPDKNTMCLLDRNEEARCISLNITFSNVETKVRKFIKLIRRKKCLEIPEM